MESISGIVAGDAAEHAHANSRSSPPGVRERDRLPASAFRSSYCKLLAEGVKSRSRPFGRGTYHATDVVGVCLLGLSVALASAGIAGAWSPDLCDDCGGKSALGARVS